MLPSSVSSDGAGWLLQEAGFSRPKALSSARERAALVAADGELGLGPWQARCDKGGVIEEMVVAEAL